MKTKYPRARETLVAGAKSLELYCKYRNIVDLTCGCAMLAICGATATDRPATTAQFDWRNLLAASALVVEQVMIHRAAKPPCTTESFLERDRGGQIAPWHSHPLVCAYCRTRASIRLVCSPCCLPSLSVPSSQRRRGSSTGNEDSNKHDNRRRGDDYVKISQ